VRSNDANTEKKVSGKNGNTERLSFDMNLLNNLWRTKGEGRVGIQWILCEKKDYKRWKREGRRRAAVQV